MGTNFFEYIPSSYHSGLKSVINSAQTGKISTMKGFQIIVIGGVGSVTASLLGGIILSLIEALATTFIHPSYRDIYGFIFMLLVLLIKPTGLFGEKQREA